MIDRNIYMIYSINQCYSKWLKLLRDKAYYDI